MKGKKKNADHNIATNRDTSRHKSKIKKINVYTHISIYVRKRPLYFESGYVATHFKTLKEKKSGRVDVI